MTTYFPRMRAALRVPVVGSIQSRLVQSHTAETFLIDAEPHRVSLIKNDSNAADEVEIGFRWEDAGVDPRVLAQANLELFMWDASAAAGGAHVDPTRKDSQFLGMVVQSERKMGRDGLSVSLKALDYTTLFLAQKDLPPDGCPHFEESLSDAWARICDHVGFYDYDEEEIVSSVDLLRDSIEFRGTDNLVIGDSVLERVRRLGKVQAMQDEKHDAWTAWKTICDSLGLMTWIEGPVCVVASPGAYYAEEEDPIVLRYGDNIEQMQESRDHQHINNKGIHLTSYDPFTFSCIEAFFPARNDKAFVKRKRVKATSGSKTPSTGKHGGLARHSVSKVKVDGLADISDYEHFNYPYPCTQKGLENIAERVFEERSRQELQGSVVTTEMTLYRRSGRKASVFDLRHGQPIQVLFDQDVLDPMRDRASVDAREAYLIERGYQRSMARLLAEDAGFLAKLSPLMVTKTIGIECDSQADSFKATIHYCSRFNVTTGASDMEAPSNGVFHEAASVESEIVTDQGTIITSSRP